MDASAILLTTSRALAEAVAAEVERQLETLPPTAGVARPSIDGAAMEPLSWWIHSNKRWSFQNELAPEHLSLHDTSLMSKIQNAGSIFPRTVEPGSGEATMPRGPNHVFANFGSSTVARGVVGC